MTECSLPVRTRAVSDVRHATPVRVRGVAVDLVLDEQNTLAEEVGALTAMQYAPPWPALPSRSR